MFYLHGTRRVDTAEKIISDGAILPPSHDGVEGLTLFNSDEQICLSKFCIENNPSKDYECALDDFSVGNITFMIFGEFDLQKPILVTSKELFMDDDIYYDKNNPVGYTNYYDEYRVKGEIPISKVIAIGYPYEKKINAIARYKDIDIRVYNEKLSSIFSDIKHLHRLMKSRGLTVPVFDSSDVKAFYDIKDISAVSIKTTSDSSEFRMVH